MCMCGCRCVGVSLDGAAYVSVYVGVWVCHWMELHKCVCVYVGVWVCHWMELHKCVMEAAELLVVWVYICTYVRMYVHNSFTPCGSCLFLMGWW